MGYTIAGTHLGGALLAAALVLWPSAIEAQTTTQIMIRVVAHYANIIGSAVRGARITVRDGKTGSLLARAVQQDTGFLAELELEGPTQIRIEAEGPLEMKDAIQRVSRTMLVVPASMYWVTVSSSICTASRSN